MSVLDLAVVKAHLNITAATYDAELSRFIDAAEAALARRVGPLAATATTVVVDGARCSLVLPIFPAGDLTSVTDADGNALDVGDLRISGAGVVEYADGRRVFYSRSYTVVYAAGYAPLPADLEMAALEMVRHLWVTQRGSGTRPGSPPSNELSNTLPGAVYALPIRVQQLIAPYTIIPGF